MDKNEKNAKQERINNDYAEIVSCEGISPCGMFLVNDDNTVEWIDLRGC